MVIGDEARLHSREVQYDVYMCYAEVLYPHGQLSFRLSECDDNKLDEQNLKKKGPWKG